MYFNEQTDRAYEKIKQSDIVALFSQIAFGNLRRNGNGKIYNNESSVRLCNIGRL